MRLRAGKRSKKIRRFFPATFFLLLALTPGAPALAAQVSCEGLYTEGWPTKAFFKRASAADVSRCIAYGKDVNARDKIGATPLHRAARYSETPGVVKALLKRGADLNARDKFGGTPLHRAAGFNTPEVVAALIKAEADVNARIKTGWQAGWTPLHQAAKYSKTPEVVAVLIKAGADVNAREDEGGMTPLHLAAVFNTPEFAAALIKAGADVNARDKGGMTPLLDAAVFNTPGVADVLIKAGMDVNARFR